MQVRSTIIIAAIALTLLAAASSVAAAQVCAPYAVPLSGGYTHSYERTTVCGTFIPYQTDVSEAYYETPGISPFGVSPGGGYAYNAGIGFTPCGYGPYGDFTYL
jgi:hypothetical protein